MIAFICLFFPAILAVWLFETLGKHTLNLKQIIYRYCFYNISINFLCFAIKRFILTTANQPLYYFSSDMIPSTAFNYIVMAVVSALVIVIVEVLFSKKIKLSVEELENENKQ